MGSRISIMVLSITETLEPLNHKIRKYLYGINYKL